MLTQSHNAHNVWISQNYSYSIIDWIWPGISKIIQCEILSMAWSIMFDLIHFIIANTKTMSGNRLHILISMPGNRHHIFP